MAEKLKKEPAAFEIYAASANYNGVHPCGVRFEQGVGRTTVERQAEHCRNVGLAVFDVNDEDDARALKTFLRKRAGGPAEEAPAAPSSNGAAKK